MQLCCLEELRLQAEERPQDIDQSLLEARPKNYTSLLLNLICTESILTMPTFGHL